MTAVRVSLLRIDGEPHPYAIDTKESKKSASIIRTTEGEHTLYFVVTDDEHVKGVKL